MGRGGEARFGTAGGGDRMGGLAMVERSGDVPL